MNTAKRLLAIFDALMAVPVDRHTQSERAWAVALGLDPNTPDAEDETAMALSAFRSELGLVITRLDDLGVPNDLYLSQFSRIRAAASTTSLKATWNNIAESIKPPDVRLALAWAADKLQPDGEGELDEAELTSLKEGFDRLQEGIAEAELPPAMRAFAEKQLGILRVALRMYHVRGITVVEEALEQTFGAAQKAKKAMAAEADGASPKAQGFMQRANEHINKVIHVLDSTNKAHKGGASMLDMADGLNKALEWIKNLPGN